MSNRSRFSETDRDAVINMVDGVYAMAAGEASLSSAVRSYLELIGDFGAGLFYHDPALGILVPPEIIGESPALFKAYHQKHGSFNPLFQAGIDRLMAGEIVVSDELMPFESLKNTPYYKEVLGPIRARRSLAFLVAGGGQKCASIATGRYEESGEYLPEHYQITDLFRRHFSRAMHILELVEESIVSEKSFVNSIETLPVGVMVITDRREILAANERARRHISTCDSLNARNKKLAVGLTRHTRENFNEWWKKLVSHPTHDGAIFQDRDLKDVWEIEANRISLQSYGKTVERRWMLTLRERPASKGATIPFLMQQLGLTKAEAYICVHLCRAGDAVSAARATRLSPHTVRAHLKSAYRKTGTSNQVQLALKLSELLH